MTLRIDRIEIRSQPERKRYWAEAEVYCDSGFRVKQIVTPEADGRNGIFAALMAWCDELDPPPKPAKVYWEAQGDPTEWPERVDPAEGLEKIVLTPDQQAAFDRHWATVDTLRAEAEAAGVRVDRRWGETRLLVEIDRAKFVGRAEEDGAAADGS